MVAGRFEATPVQEGGWPRAWWRTTAVLDRPAMAALPRAPGDGADRPAHHSEQQGYVYVARSRRAGGLSLGVDLTPHGHCSFSCIYCQASHPPIRNPDLRVDVELLRAGLRERLSSPDAPQLRDLVLAGSGEPSGAIGFPAALQAIESVCRETGFDRPRRIFTNGRHLDSPEVAQAFSDWIAGGGEVWVKLDGATSEVLSLVNGRTIDAAAHLGAIWRFARLHPIGVQSMFIEGEGLPPADEVAAGVVEAIGAAVDQGAKLTAVHLLTLARTPSDSVQAARLRPVSAERLEGFASRLRDRSRLPVTIYPAY